MKKPLSEEKLLELGRKHFDGDFPNPKREGCPAKNQLKLLAENPRQAKEFVLNHISFCSPCYRTYGCLLQLQKARFSLRSTTVWDAREEEIVGMFVSNATRGIRSRGRRTRRRNSNPSINGQIRKIENPNGTYLAQNCISMENLFDLAYKLDLFPLKGGIGD
jgi:hypothetical protein